MKRFKIRLVFDYFDQRDYAVARGYEKGHPTSVRVDDEYPAFWVDIDTGDRNENLALADAMITEMEFGG